jgi:hypothetical protein
MASNDADEAEALTNRAVLYVVDHGGGSDTFSPAALDEGERSRCLAAGLDPLIDDEHSVAAGNVISTE